ncbi:MAG: hypothetical protein B7733_13110 [Myxococcales bacterium FL481]|nr:MAG: hypothetical protein B7733_13110 [Myxococcales bacterium FL481]
MARRGNSNKVGEIRVDVTADTDKLQSGLKDAERQTKQSASKMGRDVEGFSKRVENTLGPLERLQAILGKLLIPVAVLASVTGLLNRWKAVAEEARRAEQATRDVEAAALKLRDSLAGGDRGLAGELRSIRDQFGGFAQQIEDDARRRAQSVSGFRLGTVQRVLVGGETPEEIEARARKAVALVNRQLDQAINDARTRQKTAQRAQQQADTRAFIEAEANRQNAIVEEERKRKEAEDRLHQQRMANIAKETQELQRRTRDALVSAQQAAEAEATATLRQLATTAAQIAESVNIIRRKGGL